MRYHLALGVISSHLTITQSMCSAGSEGIPLRGRGIGSGDAHALLLTSISSHSCNPYYPSSRIHTQPTISQTLPAPRLDGEKTHGHEGRQEQSSGRVDGCFRVRFPGVDGDDWRAKARNAVEAGSDAGAGAPVGCGEDFGCAVQSNWSAFVRVG